MKIAFDLRRTQTQASGGMKCLVEAVLSLRTTHQYLLIMPPASEFCADARDPKEFGEALFRVFIDAASREILVARGSENLKRFPWERAAAQTLAAYQRAQC